MIEVVTSYASETADETCLNGRGVSLDIDDHIHCCNCFRVVCSYDRCTTIKCSVCYITLHACKLEDHLLLCPKLRVPCPNASFGCPLNIRRDKICVHLEHCPASIVLCNLQWNRRVLSKYAKRKLKRYARGLDKVESTSAVDETEIDVWSAIHDQEVLMESYRTRRSERKRLCDYHNPLHPLLPLRLPFEIIDTFDDLDSSDEENRLKEIEKKKKRSPFENCYLCKVDPTQQHLHTLGNMQTHDPHKIRLKTRPEVKTVPAFYAQRNLYIDIIREHISLSESKGENNSWVRAGISVFTYFCGEPMRRSEYASHYELSHMVADELIERCPMYSMGCPFFYYRNVPKWGVLKYNHFLSSVALRPPTFETVDYKGMSLSELPLILLCQVLEYLDAGSLYCVSSTCKRLRSICFHNFLSSAMVQIKWEESGGKWFAKNFVWQFSKAQTRIRQWQRSKGGVMEDHLNTCSFCQEKAPMKQSKIPLHGMVEPIIVTGTSNA